MESHEVLRQAIDRVGAKRAAAAVNVSASLVYKWCEEPGEQGPASGARNPLDRLAALAECTGDESLVQWLCQQRGGYFVKNPEEPRCGMSAQYVSHTRQMLRDFSDLLEVMSASIADDGRIDRREAERIRKEWEDLKQFGECFVHACEAGVFARER